MTDGMSDIFSCPGCADWSLEIHWETLDAMSTLVATEGGGLGLDQNAAYEAIDDALSEHLAECQPLAEYVATARQPSEDEQHAADMVAEGSPVTEL